MDRYNKITEIYELHKNEYSHKSTRPTEIVKLIFEFLKIQGEQFCNIFGIIKYVYRQ